MFLISCRLQLQCDDTGDGILKVHHVNAASWAVTRERKKEACHHVIISIETK